MSKNSVVDDIEQTIQAHHLLTLLEYCIGAQQVNIVVHVADGVDMVTTPSAVRCRGKTIELDVDIIDYDR